MAQNFKFAFKLATTSLALVTALVMVHGATTYAAQVVTGQAGKVANISITTRQVMMYALIENAIGRENQITPSLENTHSREFIRETTAALIENAVFLEAQAFSTATLKPGELESQKRQVAAKLKKNKTWKSLDVTDKELEDLLEHKLRAKKFIQFKIDSSSIPISDKEIKDYYEANRVRFDDQPFEKHKATIRDYLNRTQVDRRLKDWFDLLNAKYKIRNLLSRE